MVKWEEGAMLLSYEELKIKNEKRKMKNRLLFFLDGFLVYISGQIQVHGSAFVYFGSDGNVTLVFFSDRITNGQPHA